MTPGSRGGGGKRRIAGVAVLALAAGLAAGRPPLAAGAPPPDAALFGHLDLQRTDLTRVRILVERKNYEAARRALSEHFQQRRVRTGFWPPDPRSSQNPDDLVRHVFSFYGSEEFDAGDPIGWNQVFLNDRELTFALNRHQHLTVLGAAYRRTSETKYARAFVAQVRDWIERNGAPNGGGWAAWRNLEVAIRIGVWSDVFFQFLPAAEFTPDDQALMLQSLHAQAEWLAPQIGPNRGQWSHSLATGLAAVALLFPEFKQAAPWREQAYDALVEDLQDVVHADGSHRTLSPHYHNATLSTFWLPLKLAVENRYRVPPQYRATLERMCAYQAYLRRPDGRYPAFNASDPQDTRMLLTAAAQFFGRADFAYILTFGKSGTPPTSTSLLFPQCGVAVLRDAWTANANYLALDAGPHGTAYQHEDKLGFELAAFGRTALVDPGRYTLDPSEPLTGHLTTTHAHNTLTVDGAGQMRDVANAAWRPEGNAPVCWVSRPAFDYVAAVYTEGYRGVSGDLKHFRRVLFVKDKKRPYWVLSDRVVGTGSHRLTSRFQFAPGTVEERRYLGYATKARWGNLAICPKREAAAKWKARIFQGSREPLGGWVSPRYGKIEPAPQLLYEYEATLPAQMEYTLIPFLGSATTPTVRAATGVDRGPAADVTALEIDCGEIRDTVVIDHGLGKTDRAIDDLQTHGCFVVVRKDSAGKTSVLIDADAGGARPPGEAATNRPEPQDSPR